jgi:hypothetical protein
MSTGNGDLFVSLSVFEDASFDGCVIIHVNSFNEKSSKSSPEGGEDGAAEDAKWSKSILEIMLGFTMSDIIIVSEFSWLCIVREIASWENFRVRCTVRNSIIPPIASGVIICTNGHSVLLGG